MIRRRRSRLTLLSLLTCIFLFFILPTLHLHPPLPSPPPSLDPGRVFIASNHWNSESILRSHWSDAVTRLIIRLGVENVYFSLYESGSWDNTKGALRELDERLEKLGVERRVILEETTHADEISRTPRVGEEGWIVTPRGRKELRRIPYLARARNRVLEPLLELQAGEGGGRNESFDRLLFLNDVIFTVRPRLIRLMCWLLADLWGGGQVEDALNLLNTRNGEYSAACSLDFLDSTKFYDTFALRDINGRPAASLSYPFFASGPSRNALLANLPVPVRSCWNGMVAFDAAPFLLPSNLRFRGVPDSLAKWHVEGSECCLIHYDNPVSGKGVWLNPNVRVAYRVKGWELIRRGVGWPGRWEKVWGGVVGIVTAVLRLPWGDGKVAGRIREWGGSEPGADCLIDEMQVLVHNGWKHL
ncbi:cryptococcal mannosyltransferase 1-domain-containing protein [Tuber brumale]|nr:cryptococcal mannosyltransferase 1-domain-containing protein [Tuber brumale]